jgi:hypothetical protein
MKEMVENLEDLTTRTSFRLTSNDMVNLFKD